MRALIPLLQMAGMLAAAFVAVAVATQLETAFGLDTFTQEFVAELQKAVATK